MTAVLLSKKGVSPLIATVLLIAFAVALGSVVLNWGLNLNLEKSENKCKDVEIKARTVNSVQVCFGGIGQNGYINFVIDNTGKSDVRGLAIWIVGEKSKFYDLDNIEIKPGSLYERKDKEIRYDFLAFGKISQVQFIPKIRVDDKVEICSRNIVKVEKVGVCSQ